MNLVGELARTGAVWCLEPVDYTVHQTAPVLASSPTRFIRPPRLSLLILVSTVTRANGFGKCLLAGRAGENSTFAHRLPP